MHLKILLPSRIFAEVRDVKRIVAETSEGHYGFLPQRLDCVAELEPGIFSYETAGGKTTYVAVDIGILVKSGLEVMVSARHAIGGVDLGKLQETVEKEFLKLDEEEKNVRYVMAKLESSFIQRLQKFEKHKNEI
ncbi:F0F1 ATP synthase subunit epsilon [Christiangramia fulva]|uniref:F0F1 ATP synthase subunit epsilon n=2 Tax=Christiangramia fulva TaxID=2126553 RepID=A0A2R3Z2E2_9FLAO|nr:F0F1 ATP synthase subunit epsilon [Christiangramia fulva]